MDKKKMDKLIARGGARWYPSRLEGVQKNRGIKKIKKPKKVHKQMSDR